MPAVPPFAAEERELGELHQLDLQSFEMYCLGPHLKNRCAGFPAVNDALEPRPMAQTALEVEEAAVGEEAAAVLEAAFGAQWDALTTSKSSERRIARSLASQ